MLKNWKKKNKNIMILIKNKVSDDLVIRPSHYVNLLQDELKIEGNMKDAIDFVDAKLKHH